MTSMEAVARKAGVSKSTVSRVLSGFEAVNGETRRRVMDACHDLDYRLNPNIQDLVLRGRRGATRNVALVMVNLPFSTEAYLDIINSLIQTAARRAYHLMLTTIRSGDRTVQDLPSLLRDERIDGMFISGSLTPDSLAALRSLGVPGVIYGIYRESLLTGFGNVGPDLYENVRGVLEKMAARGAKKIAYAEENHNLYSDEIYFDAFLDLVPKFHLSFDESDHYVGHGRMAGIVSEMKPVFMKRNLPFDSVCAMNFRIAREVEKLSFMHRCKFNSSCVMVGSSIPLPESGYDDLLIQAEKRNVSLADAAFDMLSAMMEKRTCALRVLI